MPTGVLIWIVVWDSSAGGHITWLGGLWSHLQGVVSAVLYLRKDDIRAECGAMLRSVAGRPLIAATKRSATVVPIAADNDDDRETVSADERAVENEGDAELVDELESMAKLSREAEARILALEQEPMVVVELARWERHGRFPRSSDGLTRALRASDVVIFISHRWWAPREGRPDDNRGTKYARRGAPRAAARDSHFLSGVRAPPPRLMRPHAPSV